MVSPDTITHGPLPIGPAYNGFVVRYTEAAPAGIMGWASTRVVSAGAPDNLYGTLFSSNPPAVGSQLNFRFMSDIPGAYTSDHNPLGLNAPCGADAGFGECVPIPTTLVIFSRQSQAGVTDATETDTFQWQYCGQPAAPLPPPDLPDAPTAYPSQPGCQAASFQDLADLICRMLVNQYGIDTDVKRVLSLVGGSGGGTADPPTPVAPGTPEPVPADATGVVVDVQVPAYVGGWVGPPREYPLLGWLELGTADGWLPAVAVRHTPLLVTPLPPGVTQAVVSVRTDATASFRWIRPT